MKKVIRVLREDIRKGECGDPQGCAVARAMMRELRGKVDQVGVCRSYIETTKDGIITEYKAPRSVVRFIDKFDSIGDEEFDPASGKYVRSPVTRKSLQPFNFILEPPC